MSYWGVFCLSLSLHTHMHSSCVRVVNSTRSGMGKSLFITRMADKLTEYTSMDARHVTIPIHGPEVTSDTVMEFLKDHMKGATSTIFHFDIAPTVSGGYRSDQCNPLSPLLFPLYSLHLFLLLSFLPFLLPFPLHLPSSLPLPFPPPPLIAPTVSGGYSSDQCNPLSPLLFPIYSLHLFLLPLSFLPFLPFHSHSTFLPLFPFLSLSFLFFLFFPPPDPLESRYNPVLSAGPTRTQ